MPVPPVAVAEAVPLDPPEQLTFVRDKLIVMGGGCDIAGLVVANDWQPFMSTTETV